jgi:hypothetical protein
MSVNDKLKKIDQRQSLENRINEMVNAGLTAGALLTALLEEYPEGSVQFIKDEWEQRTKTSAIGPAAESAGQKANQDAENEFWGKMRYFKDGSRNKLVASVSGPMDFSLFIVEMCFVAKAKEFFFTDHKTLKIECGSSAYMSLMDANMEKYKMSVSMRNDIEPTEISITK